MTPAARKKALKERGLTYAKVGALADPPVSPNVVYAQVHEIAGQKSQRVREVIAQAIERPYDEVYPARGKRRAA